jgi:hypothetical protein
LTPSLSHDLGFGDVQTVVHSTVSNGKRYLVQSPLSSFHGPHLKSRRDSRNVVDGDVARCPFDRAQVRLTLLSDSKGPYGLLVLRFAGLQA